MRQPNGDPMTVAAAGRLQLHPKTVLNGRHARAAPLRAGVIYEPERLRSRLLPSRNNDSRKRRSPTCVDSQDRPARLASRRC
jgi:hypothetical protein